MHAQPSSGARCLIFGRTVCLLPYFICANSESSGKTARIRRLTWAFAGHICDRYHNPMSLLIWCMNTILCYISQFDMTFDLTITVGHFELYLMVQWFWHICILKTIQWLNIILWDCESVWPDVWPIFDGPLNLPYILKSDVFTLYFVVMSLCKAAFVLKQCRSSDFALYLK